MKNLILLISLILASSLIFAQAPPEAFNYSGVARDAQGNPISEKTIGVELSILKGSPTGAVQYRERHFVNTDKFGVFNCTVGQGSIQQGTFSAVNWSNDSYYLRVGLDAGGGTNFVVLGTTQLLSVPYALYAKSAGNIMNSVGFFAKQTVGSFQPIGSNNTTIKFNSEDFDSGNNFNTTTSEFTVPVSGVYHFDAVVDFYFGTGTTTQLVQFGISVNGTLKYFTKLQGNSNGDNYSGVMTTNLYLNSGDIVKLVAQKFNPGNVDASGSGNGGNYFTGYRVY
jgi:hypothetical protein